MRAAEGRLTGSFERYRGPVSTVRQTLVVVDGRVDDEKLAELLDLQAEQPELDFKRFINPGAKHGLIELASHVAAMSVLGGYIIGGVDGQGVPTGDMDSSDERPFDEARLAPMLRKYLPEPVTIRARVTQRDGHAIVLIYVAPHPNGYSIFHTDDQYRNAKGRDVIVFRAGDAFWRDGTSSVRISQAGMEQIIARRIAAAKSEWIDEQQIIRRRERAEIEAGYAARGLAGAPLGTLHFGLPGQELRIAVLELLRAPGGPDRIALQHLLNDAVTRAAAMVDTDDEDELSRLLDKVAAIGAAFLEYEQDEFLARTVGALAAIYAQPLGPHDDYAFSMSGGINPTEKAPRVFLTVIERIYALGALAVRLRRWEAIRVLTLQHPDRVDDYWKNWLRHALTIGSGAKQFERRDDDGQIILTNLLTRAATVVEEEPALHPDTSDSDAILTSLAQFDLLANLTAIDGSGSGDSGVFYTNWARFRQQRVQPVADRVVSDPELRRAVFRDHNDADLAVAFEKIGAMAAAEGARYDGFSGWGHTPVGEFIAKNPPDPPSTAGAA